MYKILIADDEEIEINAYKIMIGNNFDDVTVLTASNGVEAMLVARGEQPDIVFMDIEMPGLDGLSAIGELKREAPDMRFIVHTAYSNFEYAQKAVKVGADDFLLKPVKMQVLIDTIRANIACVEKKRSELFEFQKLTSRLSQFKPFIEKDIVFSVVNGVEGQAVLSQYAAMFDLRMTQVFCMIFIIADVPAAEPASAENSIRRKSALALDIVDTIKQVCQCIASEYVSGSVLAIIPFEKPANEYDIRLWSVQLANFVRNKLKSSAAIKVGIGSLTTLDTIHSSYYEAYRIISDDALDISVKHHGDFIRNVEYSKDIRRCEAEIGKLIISRKCAEALEQAEVLFKLVMITDNTVDGLKGRILESGAIIKRFIEENTIEGFSVAYGSDLSLLANVTSYDALKRWLFDFVENAVSEINALSHKHNSTLIYETKMYIDQNYDKEITLENVAASVCVTPYYLSRLFKKKTGENFNAYLTGVRIEKAKQFFRSTDKSIKAVSYDTGFNSQAYFCRVFKKLEGISPSEFIQNLKN